MSNAGSPYQPPIDPSYGAAPHNKSSLAWLWILLVLGGGVGLLVCCGGGGALVYFGLGVMGEEVADQLRDHPVIQEHLGGIDNIEVDFTASAARDDDDEFVFKVSGPKGSGKLIAKTATDDNGDDQVVSGSLRTATGTFEIIPQ